MMPPQEAVDHVLKKLTSISKTIGARSTSRDFPKKLQSTVSKDIVYLPEIQEYDNLKSVFLKEQNRVLGNLM